MNKRNYQRELDQLTASLDTGEAPSLLLHACCAPCSSYVMEYLSKYFAITVFFYNPNITDEEEYAKRVREEKRLIEELETARPVYFLEGTYEPALFFAAAAGLEREPEGGRRCEACFRLRLEAAAKAAKTGGFDYFTTSLTISPLKNAELLNRIGEECAARHGIRFLPSDFKKKGGYQRSIELSREYGLYRQNYCGCIFSKRERESEKSG